MKLTALPILALALSTTACSGFKLAYAFADELVESQAERYLELDSEDEDVVEAQIETYFTWHRKEMLPRYADWLTVWADNQGKGKLSREDFDRHVRDGRKLFDDTLRKAMPRVAAVLARETDDNEIERMRKAMLERNKEILENMKRPPEEVRAERLEELTDNIELTLGELTDEQVALIDDRMAQFTSPERADYWFRNRARRQQAFLKFMKERPSEAQLQSFLESLTMRAYEHSEPGYKEFSERSIQAVYDLVYDVIQTITPEQEKDLIETLRDYASDMRDLAA